MWIFLLLVVGFIVWHFIPQPGPDRPAPRFRRETRAAASDPQWIRFIEEHCESPAETAFVHAMVEAYDLKPVDGALFGTGVRLDFQVGEGRYRVDFLADRWLVIEIDGAAYHSSPQAVARDKARDNYLEGLGYTILRIPAKVVFDTPEEAVRRVRAALLTGKRSMPVPVQKSGWQRLSETMVSINNSMSEINASIERKRAVDAALADARTSFGREKCMIEAAVQSAISEVETDDWLKDQDQRYRELYEKSYADLAKLLDAPSEGRGGTAAKVIKEEARMFPPAPVCHANPEYDASIQAAYSQIAGERAAFLAEQRLKVKSDARLPSLVEKKLRKFGCPEYWTLMHGDYRNYGDS